jgi:membrane associated rhomboid family serine protease
MRTEDVLRPVLLMIGLLGAWLAGSLRLRLSSTSPSIGARTFVPHGTILLVALVAIPTTLQFVIPWLLPLFERDRAMFFAGQWWRIVTTLVVQDGGISGAIFNVITLAVVASVAEAMAGGRKLLLLFVVGGVCAEVVALSWQPVGAGNSIANFSVAGGVIACCLMRPRPWRIVAVALVTLTAHLALLVMHDIHGAAALIGFALGQILIWLPRRGRERR